MGANIVPVYYAGGENTKKFRSFEEFQTGPEDWIGATTALPDFIRPASAAEDVGVSRLPDGSSLRDAVGDDPIGWLGQADPQWAHGETGLLVKLLDAGERLPVHCHPDRAFATRNFQSPFGKTEGWIVMDDAPGGSVWLGFREDVASEQLREWIEHQRVDEMLSAMNEIPARPGDVFYVPAGLPHAIGEGVFITEVQEPTSFSILAEFKSYGLSDAQATLSLGWDLALECFDRSGYRGAALERLKPSPRVFEDGPGARVSTLFEDEADPYFRAWRADVTDSWELPRAFSILVVERGGGSLQGAEGEYELSAGQTWILPCGAGARKLVGRLRCLVCLPPAGQPASP